jgi:hypothetical protein
MPNDVKQASNADPGGPSADDPLAEAEAIKNLLTEAQARLARLLAGLKRQRRQARAVAAAVRSLRELPPPSP